MFRFVADIRTTSTWLTVYSHTPVSYTHLNLNGEERWVRNVVIRGEIEDSEYAMIFLRDITEAKVAVSYTHLTFCK